MCLQPFLLSLPCLQLLLEHGGDLSALPAAFTAARKPDADALLWLDRQVHLR